MNINCKNSKYLFFSCALLFVSFSAYALPNNIHVVLFILDGTPKNFLYQQIEDGNLPIIKEYLWDDGAHANAAITTFPSTSASAYQGFITGLFAGRSGIPYLQWYDRTTQKEIDYLGLDYSRVNKDLWNLHAFQDPNIEGIYYPVTILEKLKGYPTATLYSEVSRGATDRHPKNLIPALSDTFLVNRQDMLDRRAFDVLNKLFKKKKKELPKFTLVGLYSVDVLEHKDGTPSEDAKYALVQFDVFLKEFIELLKKRGIFDNTYLLVVADHGMHNITGDVDLSPILKKAGLKIKIGNLQKKDSNVFVSERGVASAHLYLKGDIKGSAPSLERLKKYPVEDGKYVDVIDLVRNDDGLSLVVARNGNNRIEVYSKDCHGTITKVNLDSRTYYGYEPNSCDPLNYCGEKQIKQMCSGRFYDDREWLKKTWNMRYSDGVVQLGQIFDDGRAGDIFVVADDKNSFYKEKHATHGSLIDEDMQVPVLIYGKGIPKGEFGPIRTVDLYPTMLSWFGLRDDGNHDGIGIFDFYTSTLQHSYTALANMELFMLNSPELAKVPNLEDVKTEFRKKFSKELKDRGLMDVLNNESKRRNAQLKKFERLLHGLAEKDLEFTLVNEQFKKIKKDIRRLEDVRILLQ